MEILKFDGGRSPQKRTRLVTVIAGAFLVAAVGSTFAANISINANTNGSLEYAQGVTQAVACNPGILIVPANRFNNVAGAGSFQLETITVTDTASVTTSTNAGFGKCSDQTFRLRAFGNTGNALTLSAGSTPTYCDVKLSNPAWNTGTSVVDATLQSGCTGSVTKLSKGFALAFTSPSLAAADIFKITIESF
jgi:hypothetical protein